MKFSNKSLVNYQIDQPVDFNFKKKKKSKYL